MINQLQGEGGNVSLRLNYRKCLIDGEGIGVCQNCHKEK